MKYAGVAGGAALAGCTGGDGGDGGDGGGGGDGGDGGGGTTTQGTTTDPMTDGERPVKMLTILPFAYDPEKKKYEDTTGVSLKRNIVAQATTQQKMHAGGNEEFDIMASGPSIGGDIAFTDPPLTMDIPLDKVPNWETDKITDLFTNPEERIPQIGHQATTIKDIVWRGKDPMSADAMSHPVFQFNLDAMGSNPKFVAPDDISKWSAMFDDQYKGKTTIQTTTPHSILETMTHLMDKGVMKKDASGLNEPSKDQLDTTIDFLIKQKQEGQFRSLWTQYGEAVNLMANEEAIVGDVWQPVVFTVRQQGAPCHYHTMSDGIQGYRFWWGGVNPTNPGAKNHGNVDEAYAWYNMHLGAWYPGFIQAIAGFYTPQFPNKELVRTGEDETGKGMGPEYYDWAHEGKATYQSIDKPFLFDPTKYDWSMEEGTPSPDGKKRDTGGIDEKVSRIRMVQIWPKTGGYMLQRWKEFTGA